MLATGVFLTSEEIERVKSLVPGPTRVMKGFEPSERTMVTLHATVNQMAVAHGLRDGSFWYSVSNDGELIVPDGYENEPFR